MDVESLPQPPFFFSFFPNPHLSYVPSLVTGQYTGLHEGAAAVQAERNKPLVAHTWDSVRWRHCIPINSAFTESVYRSFSPIMVKQQQRENV